MTVGDSPYNPKTIYCGDYCNCPYQVDKSNWDQDQVQSYYLFADDTFRITTQNKYLTATRTDADSSWDLNLVFDCCTSNRPSALPTPAPAPTTPPITPTSIATLTPTTVSMPYPYSCDTLCVIDNRFIIFKS